MAGAPLCGRRAPVVFLGTKFQRGQCARSPDAKVRHGSSWFLRDVGRGVAASCQRTDHHALRDRDFAGGGNVPGHLRMPHEPLQGRPAARHRQVLHLDHPRHADAGPGVLLLLCRPAAAPGDDRPRLPPGRDHREHHHADPERRRVHLRDLPRRHPVGAQGPDGGLALARRGPTPPPCARSSCPRPCASACPAS